MNKVFSLPLQETTKASRLDPMFHDTARKLSWGSGQLKTLNGNLEKYARFGIKTYIEPDQNDPEWQRAVVESDKLPFDIEMITGDIVRCIRGALDYTISSIFRDKGLDDQLAYFPMAKDASGLENQIKGRLEKHGVTEISNVIRKEIQPFPSGNFLLAALNELDNRNKHRAIGVVTQFACGPMPDYTKGVIFAENNTIRVFPGQTSSEPIPVGADIRDGPSRPTALTAVFGPGEPLAGEKIVPYLSWIGQAANCAVIAIQKAYLEAKQS